MFHYYYCCVESLEETSPVTAADGINDLDPSSKMRFASLYTRSSCRLSCSTTGRASYLRVHRHTLPPLLGKLLLRILLTSNITLLQLQPLLLCLSQADALVAAGIQADSFLLLNVPDEMLISRVVGRRLDPETGDIYHLEYSPPPADVVDRRDEEGRRSW